MNWVKVLAQDELAEGEPRLVQTGTHTILLVYHEAQIYAIASAHQQPAPPPSEGQELPIAYPWHHSAFDIQAGDVKHWSSWPDPTPGQASLLPIFPTRVEDGDIWVGIYDPTS